jgi:hypothetical protein
MYLRGLLVIDWCWVSSRYGYNSLSHINISLISGRDIKWLDSTTMSRRQVVLKSLMSSSTWSNNTASICTGIQNLIRWCISVILKFALYSSLNLIFSSTRNCSNYLTLGSHLLTDMQSIFNNRTSVTFLWWVSIISHWLFANLGCVSILSKVVQLSLAALTQLLI